ncbi:hypothetical protein ACLK11_06300 [Escherichia coli]
MSARISHEKSVIDNLVYCWWYWVSPLVWASGRFAILPTANYIKEETIFTLKPGTGRMALGEQLYVQ